MLFLQGAQLTAVRAGNHHHVRGFGLHGGFDDVFDHHLAADAGVLLGDGSAEARAHAAGKDQRRIHWSGTSSGASADSSTASSVGALGSSPLLMSIIAVPMAV